MSQPAVYLLVFFGSVGLGILLLKSRVLLRLFKNKEDREREVIEDVLKLLYHVEQSDRTAGLEGMAGALRIPTSRLFKLIEKMATDQLIKTTDDQVRLTKEGNEYAIKIIRVHRIWEKYLSEKTGIDKREWHDRAELKEHNLSDEEAEKLYHELGSPRFDPHGDPIPTETGEIFESNWKSLAKLKANTIAKIVHLEDEPKVVYEQIVSQNLFMGSQLKMISSDESQIRFYCEGNEYQLSPIVASNISVRVLTEQEVFEESSVRLSALDQGQNATVKGISSECRGASRRRLLDLGFVKGTPIKMEYEGPMKNPKAYLIRNTLIALRKDQADFILIEKE